MTQPETTSSQTGTEELFQGDERLDQLHRVLLMMLKDFAALCESQGFSWIAMYGTAIGALRHGGFIPWDDDLDICMTRADLDALTALVNGENERWGRNLGGILFYKNKNVYNIFVEYRGRIW